MPTRHTIQSKELEQHPLSMNKTTNQIFDNRTNRLYLIRLVFLYFFLDSSISRLVRSSQRETRSTRKTRTSFDTTTNQRRIQTFGWVKQSCLKFHSNELTLRRENALKRIRFSIRRRSRNVSSGTSKSKWSNKTKFDWSLPMFEWESMKNWIKLSICWKS